MNYENAADILPKELLKRVQKFAAGKLIYVPETIGKRSWGETSGYKQYLTERNQEIKEKFISGCKKHDGRCSFAPPVFRI